MPLPRRAESAKKDFDPIPNLEEIEYEARLVYVADLGMQTGMEWKGVQKPDSQQISLGLEVIGETIEMTDSDDNKVTKPRILWTKPFNIFSKMTDLGNELKMYNVFDSSGSDGDVPDWDAQLGKPCSITVEHVHGKGENSGNTYDNIAALVPIPTKYQDAVGKATVEPCIGDADDPINACTKALFGLTRYVHEKRLGQSEVEGGDEDEIPF